MLLDPVRSKVKDVSLLALVEPVETTIVYVAVKVLMGGTIEPIVVALVLGHVGYIIVVKNVIDEV